MRFDPQGTGASADDLLVRRGIQWESAQRLARQAAAAERAGFGHGVSVTSPEANQKLARDPNDAVRATRRAFEEAGFDVCYTPTANDKDHHTILLPTPVTGEIAILFNTILQRTP